MSYNRKTAPGVKNGTVQKKNNHTYSYANTFVVDRESPWKGFRHMVTKNDLRNFIEIIPNWDFVQKGIERIFLTGGHNDSWGVYHYDYDTLTGIVHLPAWHKELWFDINAWYFEKNIYIFKKLDVSFDKKDDNYQCRFTIKKAKAFMLLHVFLHEIGHHVDRMATKDKKQPVNGEEYADKYADETCELIWDNYCDVFGKP